MLLHKTSLMELHYDPATDILKIIWPDIQQATGMEIDHTFKLISESVKHYFITKILIDSSKLVNLPNRDLHLQVSAKFVEALQNTGIKKIARIVAPNPEREKLTAEVTADIHRVSPMQHHYGNFTTEASAIQWLLQDASNEQPVTEQQP